jgi:hypothetical protein
MENKPAQATPSANPVEQARKVMTTLDGWQRRTRWAGVSYAVMKK